MALPYAAPLKNSQEQKINRFIENFDGYPGNPLSFVFHDVSHALREQEIAENVSKARFKMIDLLRECVKGNSSLKFQAEKIISYLVDGVLIHSYGFKNNLFHSGYAHQKFGHLFHLPWFQRFWTAELIRFVIEDMVINKTEWKKHFKIGPEDLIEPERTLYDKINAEIHLRLAA